MGKIPNLSLVALPLMGKIPPHPLFLSWRQQLIVPMEIKFLKVSQDLPWILDELFYNSLKFPKIICSPGAMTENYRSSIDPGSDKST